MMRASVLSSKAFLDDTPSKISGVKYGPLILAQLVDIPAMLGGAPSADPWLTSYPGYCENPTRDVATWRRHRSAQVEG